nr:Ig-like domain-containing protein [Deinococcus humi]
MLAACGGSPQPASDLTAPTVTLTASQSGTTVNLSATAADNVGVTKVEFYRGSTLVNTDSTSPYTTADTVSTANNGNVTYTAKVYDAAGNVGQDSKTIAVNVTPSGETLYQGVWGWGIGNATTGELIDNGVVVFDDEVVNQGRTVATGAYVNLVAGSDQPGDRLGFALLGPISAAGKLETGFTLNTSGDDKIYFVGADDNDALELYEGSLAFEGVGAIFTASNQPGQQVEVILIQVSDTVPSGATWEAFKVRAKTLAATALKASFKEGHAASRTTNQVTPGLFDVAQHIFQISR